MRPLDEILQEKLKIKEWRDKTRYYYDKFRPRRVEEEARFRAQHAASRAAAAGAANGTSPDLGPGPAPTQPLLFESEYIEDISDGYAHRFL